MGVKRKRNGIRFTRKILQDLKLAAGHLGIAGKEIDADHPEIAKCEIGLAKKVIDKAVARELKIKRNGDKK